MNERPRSTNKRLTGSGPAPCIGFLLDWLEDSRYHWQVLRGAMDAAYERGANLLCFVGGALAAANMATEANWVFELARPPNVDALLILSGSLGNVVGSAGLSAYCRRFDPLPMCSIALRLEGMSSVCIDNAEGMRAAIEHLMRAHHVRRIAFVRGPTANDEAELRFRVYREALDRSGLPYDPDLVVSGDFTLETGRLAVSTLFGDRKLPVSSVGAIVAANDAMALGVLEELRQQGIRVPAEVAVVGFDNIEESRFVLPPLTTVSQPLADQGREAVRILLAQLRNRTEPEHATRRTDVVIRRSCGCLQGASQRKSSAPPAPHLGFDAALIRRRQHILADLARAARGELGPAGPQWDSRLLGAAADQIRGDSPDAFVRAYDDLLRRLLLSGSDPTVCGDVVSALRARLVRCIGDLNQRTHAEDLFHEARLLTANAIERIHVAKEKKVWGDARLLIRAGAAIMSAGTLDDLARAVHEHLPGAGIPRCYVVRLVEGSAGEKLGQIVLAEKPDTRRSDPVRSAVYPIRDVLRQTVLPGTDGHTFAVFPVPIGASQARGLLALEITPAVDGYAYETMRQIFEVALGRLSLASF